MSDENTWNQGELNGARERARAQAKAFSEVVEPDPNAGRESALPDNGAGSGAIDLPPGYHLELDTTPIDERGPELDLPPNVRTMINLLNMRVRRIE